MSRNESVKKYAQYIESLISQIENIQALRIKNSKYLYVKSEDMVRINDWYFYNSLIYCLVPGKEEEGKTTITDQFGSVSRSLLSSPLNVRERSDVIFYLIERNINVGCILDEDKLGGLVKYDNFLKYGIDSMTINNLFSSGEIERLLYTDDDLLDNESLKMKHIVQKCIVILDKENHFVRAHKQIKDHLFEKKDDYEAEDIQKVYEALLKLDVGENMSNAIKCVLQSRLEKRKRQETKENVKMEETPSLKKKSSKKYLSEKEYKNLRKEISIYFDTYTGMPTKDLEVDEILYCASLLFRIEADEGIVRSLYDRSNYTKKVLKMAKQNPITTYLQTYDKLKFYEVKLGTEDNITLLESYFQEIFLSPAEEYSVWKQAIGEELSSLLEKIPAGYNYETKMRPQYDKSIVKVKSRNTKK